MICGPETPGIHLGNLNPSSSWLWFDALWWRRSTAASILMGAILQPGTPWNILHLDVAFLVSAVGSGEYWRLRNPSEASLIPRQGWLTFYCPISPLSAENKNFIQPLYLSTNCVGQRKGANYQSDYMKLCYHWVFCHGVYCIYSYIFVMLNEIIHYMHCLSVWAL